jgi:hypothetical protein
VPQDDIPKRRPERSEEGRRPERIEGCLATLETTEKGWYPEPFFCRPEAQAEGSPIVKEEISRYARNDKMSRRCLAIARQDKKRTLGRTKEMLLGRTKKDARQDGVGNFLNSL